jgi:hypothetical protein
MKGQTIYENRLSAPKWCGDFGGREHILPAPYKIDPYQFTDGAATVVEVTAGAAEGATAVTVAALAYPIPRDAVLDFGGGKFARLSAASAAGDTTLDVDALPTALVDGDIARYSEYNGRVTIPSGTLCGRTYAERDAKTPFGPATDTDDQFLILYFDIANALENDDAEFYRPGSLVKENYLPEWATIEADADLLAKLRATYQCIVGVN